MNIGYILAIVVGVLVVIGGLVMLILTRGGWRRPNMDGLKGKPSRWRNMVIAAVALAVGVILWRWLLTAGNNHPQIGLWVAILVSAVAVFMTTRSLRFGAWLPFIWLGAAIVFAKVSTTQGLIVQPGSVLTAFGNGPILGLVAMICFATAIIMALLQGSGATWFAIVAAGVLFIGPNVYKTYRHPERQAITVQRGGYKAEYGIAHYRAGIVTVDAGSPRGPDGIYSVFGLQSDGYERVIRVQDRQNIECWRTGNAQFNPEQLELQLGSNGWVRPFADGRLRFLSPVKEGDLEVRLPPGVKTGIVQFGMKLSWSKD